MERAGEQFASLAVRSGIGMIEEIIVNNTRTYAEKGLVEDLRSTAEKIAIATNRAMAQDELSQDTVLLFDRLLDRAAGTLSTIRSFREARSG
jgi:hypothetical protein